MALLSCCSFSVSSTLPYHRSFLFSVLRQGQEKTAFLPVVAFLRCLKDPAASRKRWQAPPLRS